MKTPKSIVFVVGILSILLVGCQNTPTQEIVQSKNDGELEAMIENTHAIMEDEIVRVPTPTTQPQLYENCFTSTDGSVNYSIDLVVPTTETALPVLRVSPSAISEEVAESVAEVLFDNQPVYEYPSLISKQEIEEEILRLKAKLNDDQSMQKYYNGDEEVIEAVKSQYETLIAGYEKEYSDAPDNVERVPCEWVYRPVSYYLNSATSYLVNSAVDNANEDKTQSIQGISAIDDRTYIYRVYNRDEKDYRIQSIYAFMDDSDMLPVDMYSTEAPSDDEIDWACSEAKRILDSLGLGEWVVDFYEVKSWPDLATRIPLYKIEIIASPTYSGVKVTHQEQLQSLKTGDVHASNYYYESIVFQYSNSQMISFDYKSPLQVTEVVNEVAPILSFDEVAETLITQLQLTDAEYTYGVTAADVAIDQAVLGLSRIRVKNNENDFYLVPSYTFYGDLILYDENGLPVTFEMQFATINAVDGSIINTTLGY